jgi:hypothetical protein
MFSQTYIYATLIVVLELHLWNNLFISSRRILQTILEQETNEKGGGQRLSRPFSFDHDLLQKKPPESPRFQSWDERRRCSVPSSEGA